MEVIALTTNKIVVNKTIIACPKVSYSFHKTAICQRLHLFIYFRMTLLKKNLFMLFIHLALLLFLTFSSIYTLYVLLPVTVTVYHVIRLFIKYQGWGVRKMINIGVM